MCVQFQQRDEHHFTWICLPPAAYRFVVRKPRGLASTYTARYLTLGIDSDMNITFSLTRAQTHSLDALPSLL